jgi:glycosyltransferase involved in cell wall biosynthesis
MTVAISFIVPAYNEAPYIEQCLKAIVEHCEGENIIAEVIVIDNGSTDNTADLARRHSTHVETIERSSVSFARNTGVLKASHTLLAFIDADVVITRRWTQTVLNQYSDFLQNPMFIAGHQYCIRENGSWVERFWFGNIKDKLLNGGNIITTMRAFRKLGGFDDGLKTGEDYDFCTKAISANYSYIENAGYEAIHLGYPKTLAQFVRREYWHGEGDFKSYSTLIHSPVALISLCYFFIHLAALLLVTRGLLVESMLTLTLLIICNVALTKLRFQKCNGKTILRNSVLNYAYFIARSASMFRALKNRHQNY